MYGNIELHNDQSRELGNGNGDGNSEELGKGSVEEAAEQPSEDGTFVDATRRRSVRGRHGAEEEEVMVPVVQGEWDETILTSQHRSQ